MALRRQEGPTPEFRQGPNGHGGRSRRWVGTGGALLLGAGVLAGGALAWKLAQR
jgi:hypothetical protein